MGASGVAVAVAVKVPLYRPSARRMTAPAVASSSARCRASAFPTSTTSPSSQLVPGELAGDEGLLGSRGLPGTGVSLGLSADGADDVAAEEDSAPLWSSPSSPQPASAYSPMRPS